MLLPDQDTRGLRAEAINALLKRGFNDDRQVSKLLDWLAEPVVGTHVNCRTPGHQSPFRFLADMLRGVTQDFIVHANRAGSKSYYAGLITWSKCSSLAKYETTILGASLEQSEKSYKAMDGFWGLSGLQDDYLDNEPSQKRTTWKNGSLASVLTASTKSVRGPHPQALLIDEVDEIEKEVYDSALSQTQSKHGHPASLGRLSTWHRSGGMMEQALAKAEEEGIPIYRWCVAGDTLVLTDRGRVPIRDMTLADKVWTLEGFRPLSFVGRTGYNKTIRLRTRGNSSLELTADHLVLTAQGWKRAMALREGEQIVAYLSSVRRQEGPPVETMSSLLHENPPGNPPETRDNRAGPGYASGERAQMQGAEILGRYQSQNVGRPKRAVQKGAGLEQRTAMVENKFGRYPSREIENPSAKNDADFPRKKALFHDEQVGRDLGAGESCWILAGGCLYSIAECGDRSERGLLAFLAQKQGERPAEGGIPEAPRICTPGHNRDGDEGPEKDVGQVIFLDKIAEITEGPSTDVYDLTVKDGPPHFIANGILVHNCIWECLESCRDYSCSTCKLSSLCPGQQMKQADGYYKIVDLLQKLRELSDHALRTEWLCEKPGKSGGLVYGDYFDLVDHSPLDLPGYDPTKRVYLSVDWGGTHPFSVGVWQKFPKLGWVRVEEIHKGHTTNPIILAECKTKPWWRRVVEGVADPSRADLMNEWRAEGISMYPAQNAVDEGIEAVRASLKPVQGNPLFYVNRKCKACIREFEGYEERNGKPVKEKDDAMDELRYFVMRHVRPAAVRGRVRAS